MEPEGLRRLNIRSLNRRHIDALENFVERYDLEVNVGRLKTTDFLLKLWKQEEMKKRKGERYRRKMLKDAENLIMSMNTLKHGELIGAEEMRRRGREQSGEGMRGVSGLSEGLAKKLNPACPYRLLEERFDAVRALKGMDQKTPYHSLTADMHTREVLKHFGKSREFASLSRKEKGWAILATHLHDVGKGHPDGQQKKDGRVQYVGHNVVSARLAADILPGFDISEDGKRFVLAMVRYHDATLKIMDAFAGNNQPKGGQLGAYDTYTSNIEEMPKSETRAGLLKNMALMLAFTRADVAATVSSETAPQRQDLVEKIRKDNESLAQLQQALPAIVEAVMGKRSGVQQAGIVKDGSAYSYKDYGEKKAGGPSYDMAGLAKALKEEGIPPKALGIIQKAADDPAPALARGGLAVQQIEKIMKLLERFRRLTDSSP